VDPENETVGQGGALPLESAAGAGAGHEADTQEAQRAFKAKVALAAHHHRCRSAGGRWTISWKPFAPL